MIINSNVTEQDLFNSRKLAQKQQNQRPLKNKNRISKQIHDTKLAETLSHITEKLDEVKETTKKLGDVLNQSNSEKENIQVIVPVEIDSDNSEGDNIRALPNSSIFSDLVTKTGERLMSSSNSLIIKSSPSGATILGVPIYTLSGDKLRILDNDFELFPEIYKALSFTGNTGKIMTNENDILMLSNSVGDLVYTGVRDSDSKRKTFFTISLPNLVEEIQNKTIDELDLEGQGVKLIIPSNIIDIYTRLETLLGLQLSGHSDILTEASKLIDDICKRGEIQNEQQHRNALNKFSTL